MDSELIPFYRSDLEPADVLLSQGASPESRLVIRYDGSPYSHAALWTGTGVLDATLEHDIAERSLDAAYYEGQLVHVYRAHDAADKQPSIVEIARDLGEDYDKSGLYLSGIVMLIADRLHSPDQREAFKLAAGHVRAAIAALRGELANSPGRFPYTCSGLVAEAYHRAGCSLDIEVTGARSTAVTKGAEDDPAEAPEADLEELDLRGALQALFTEPNWPRDAFEQAEMTLRRIEYMRSVVTAGKGWPTRIVTPRDLSTGLTLVGELAEAEKAPRP